MNNQSVIFLMGPTASGKTALASQFIRHLPLEIVSVDSMMIYRDMNIGTAKPSAAELEITPHHLINILDPTETYSVGQFLKDAHALIEAIHAKEKIPLFVGGSMLYFKALQEGIAPLPEKNSAIRDKIDEEALALGWPALHEKLSKIDPSLAAKIKPTDRQRIQRALEVFSITGKPLSALQQAHQKKSPFRILPLAFMPEDRIALHDRIEARVDDMLRSGLIEEVVWLRQKYPLMSSMPSMRAVGYRQVWECLEGDIPEPDLRDRILFATRQYAKRQLTWLKTWPQLIPMDLLP